MKTLVKTFAFLALLFAGFTMTPQTAAAQNGPISLQVFYDELSPYGSWIDDPNYGYIWAPDVDRDFRPYVTDGHWVLTDYGWTWVSDFPWGWAAFHYGRWMMDPDYGYVWIPDTEWGPAWVTWRQTNGYIGWAPMGPGMNINLSFGRYYNVPRDRWVFVRNNDFMSINVNRYCLDRAISYRIFDLSIVIRNTRFDNDRHTTYVYGPRRDDIQRFYGREITPVHIRDYDRPGQRYDRGYLNIYRPQIQRRMDNDRVVAPRSVMNQREMRNQQESRYENNRNNDNRYNQGRSGQVQQQTNVAPNRSQREDQPYRNNNNYYQDRGSQTVQQPNSNPSRSQREDQPNRNYNNNYQNRYQQPVQQPAVTPQRSQQNPQNNQQERQQNYQRPQENRPVQAQQNNQREAAPAKNQQPSAESRQEKAKMVVNPEKNKKEESRDHSTVNEPRR